jgi:hypothetical protein
MESDEREEKKCASRDIKMLLGRVIMILIFNAAQMMLLRHKHVRFFSVWSQLRPKISLKFNLICVRPSRRGGGTRRRLFKALFICTTVSSAAPHLSKIHPSHPRLLIISYTNPSFCFLQYIIFHRHRRRRRLWWMTRLFRSSDWADVTSDEK